MLQRETFARVTTLFPCLSRLDMAQRDALLHEGQLVSRRPGTVLFEPGDRCAAFPFTLAGAVRVAVPAVGSGELTIDRVRQGEACVVTAACLLRGRTYPARGVVESEWSAVSLDRRSFLRLSEEAPAVRRFVLELLAARVAALMGLVTAVVHQRLDHRLAELLLARGPELAATPHELAQELGTSVEPVEQLLEALAGDGLIELAPRRVRVTRPGDLRLRAGVLSAEAGDGPKYEAARSRLPGRDEAR